MKYAKHLETIERLTVLLRKAQGVMEMTAQSGGNDHLIDMADEIAIALAAIERAAPQPAQDAEIERLTAALATAEAERDAATNVINQVIAILHAPQTMRSDEQMAHEYRQIYDIVTTYEDGVDTVPQPAAAPAVDAAPVGAQSYIATSDVLEAKRLVENEKRILRSHGGWVMWFNGEHYYVNHKGQVSAARHETFTEAWEHLKRISDSFNYVGVVDPSNLDTRDLPDVAPVGELTDAESARLTTPFLHTMMVCGEARDVFAGEFAAGIQQNVELENERALLSWRDRDLDSAMLHLINASARNAELIRRLQERKTR